MKRRIILRDKFIILALMAVGFNLTTNNALALEITPLVGEFKALETVRLQENAEKTFHITVSFNPAEKIVGQSVVTEEIQCKQPDLKLIECLHPASHDVYCKTEVTFQLGRVWVQIEDKDPHVNKSSTTESDWIAKASRQYKKIKGQDCESMSLSGAAAIGAIKGTARFVSAVVPASVRLIKTATYMSTRIVPAGPNLYTIVPLKAPNSLQTKWATTHNLISSRTTTISQKGELTLSPLKEQD